ncbi:2-oxoacid dehydrogenases acyltransferase (catalytic domain), partial [Rhizoctonia solani]
MIAARQLGLLASRRMGVAVSSRASMAALRRTQMFHTGVRLLAPETIKVPQMAESITEGTLKQWSKQVGDTVNQDDEVATIETDKIDVTVNAPMSGKIVELLFNEEDTVTVGADMFRIEPGEGGASASSQAPKEEKKPEPAAEESKPAPKEESEPAPAPPKEEKKEVKESKKEEKSEKKEDKKEKKEKKEDKKEYETPKPVAGSRGETRVKMNRMRLRIAERLKQSQNAAASLTTFNEIDMSSLMEMRKKYKDEVLDKQGVKLGFMSAFAKACCLALREIPVANASIEDEYIVYRDYVDLSVAVATPKGLVTPVVRNAETMNFVEIEREISALGKKARDNKLTLEDMAGGTFTISNGGVFGSLFGTPIINLPQAAVLGLATREKKLTERSGPGMHAIKDRPVVVDGKIEIRPIMVVALTYDHRLLDGREAVTFLDVDLARVPEQGCSTEVRAKQGQSEASCSFARLFLPASTDTPRTPVRICPSGSSLSHFPILLNIRIDYPLSTSMSAVAIQSLPVGFHPTFQQSRHSAAPPAALLTPAKTRTPGIITLSKPVNAQRQSPRQRKATASAVLAAPSATPKSEKSRKPRSRPSSDEEHETPSKPRGRRQNAEKQSPNGSPAPKRRNPSRARQTPSPESDPAPAPQLQKPSGRLAKHRRGFTKSTPALCAAVSTAGSAPVPVPQLSSSASHPTGLSRSAPLATPPMSQSIPARMRRTLTGNGREEQQKDTPPSPSPRRVREPSKGPLTAPLASGFPIRPVHARSPSEALFNLSLDEPEDEPQDMPVLFRNRGGDKVYAGGRFQNGPDPTMLPAPSFLTGF